MSRLSNSARAPFKPVCLALFGLALVYPLSLAARIGLADIYAEPAKNFLQENRDAGDTLTDEEWQAIESSLQRSLSMAPGDPENLTELARIHRIQLENDELNEADVERYGNLAIDYYEQAAAMRPTWPWGWSSVAQVRFELYQDTVDDYHQALMHAIRFGPWEAAVQRIVVDLGIDSWASLSIEAQQAVLIAVDRGLERQPDGLNSIVNAAQAWQTLCQAAHTTDDNRAVELSRLRRHCSELTQN